jgi:hypothetical protein
MKSHPEAGHRLLKEGGGVGPVALDVCLHHHEKVNGRGYPKGLKGDEISLFAKMGAVCDVYDAITSNRPYKTGWDPAESLMKMATWTKEGHFDERVFQAFVKSIGIYPTGSLVKLQSNEYLLAAGLARQRQCQPGLFAGRADPQRVGQGDCQLLAHPCLPARSRLRSPQADLHIHDLDMLAGYCAGWSLRTLLHEGLERRARQGRIGPAAHMSSAVGQIVNFLGTLQNEWAGAQAFSSFDTYMAPYVRKTGWVTRRCASACRS